MSEEQIHGTADEHRRFLLDADKEIESLRDQIAQRDAVISALSEQVDAERRTKAAIAEWNRTTETGRLHAELNAAREKIAAQDDEVESLKVVAKSWSDRFQREKEASERLVERIADMSAANKRLHADVLDVQKNLRERDNEIASLREQMESTTASDSAHFGAVDMAHADENPFARSNGDKESSVETDISELRGILNQTIGDSATLRERVDELTRRANQQPDNDFDERLTALEAKMVGSPSDPDPADALEIDQRVNDVARRLEGVEGKLGGVSNIHGLIRTICKDEMRHAGRNAGTRTGMPLPVGEINGP